ERRPPAEHHELPEHFKLHRPGLLWPWSGFTWLSGVTATLDPGTPAVSVSPSTEGQGRGCRCEASRSQVRTAPTRVPRGKRDRPRTLGRGRGGGRPGNTTARLPPSACGPPRFPRLVAASRARGTSPGGWVERRH